MGGPEMRTGRHHSPPGPRRGFALVLCLMLSAGAWAAQAADPPAADADDADRARARQLFRDGTTFFDLQQFDKAIAAWQEAYKVKPDPGFLYNIAQAYRLAGDAPNAIFYYKGYLRHLPKAPNRAEVEQKIASLKQLVDADHGKAAPPPPSAGAPAAPSPAAPMPPSPPAPPAAAGPPFSPVAVAPPAFDAAARPPGLPIVAATAPAGAGTANRPVDLSAAVGADLWTSGVQGSTQPSFALTLAAGYTFGGASGDALRFRLGVLLGYTFLDEPSSRETFVSVLIDPSLSVRLKAERLYLTAALGIGALAVSGLKATSALLMRNQTLMVQGTQGLLELRPALALELRLRPSLAVYAGPAIAYSPRKEHFFAPIGRIELLVGLAYRL
jgi:hypothetical protein